MSRSERCVNSSASAWEHDPIDQVEQEDDVYGFRQRRLADTCISSRFDVGWTRFIGGFGQLDHKVRGGSHGRPGCAVPPIRKGGRRQRPISD
jgi:hypothetical protein